MLGWAELGQRQSVNVSDWFIIIIPFPPHLSHPYWVMVILSDSNHCALGRRPRPLVVVVARGSVPCSLGHHLSYRLCHWLQASIKEEVVSIVAPRHHRFRYLLVLSSSSPSFVLPWRRRMLAF